MKVIIVGGGVMGMLQARELAQKGHEVVLLDKGLCGAEASWAGGGIISPLYPWRYSEPVNALATWSQAYYPNLILSLEAESGVDPELTRHGLLVLSVDDREKALAWSEERQAGWIEELDKVALYHLEQGLAPGFESALWMKQISSLRNPRLLRALGQILQHDSRVEVHEQTAVEALVSTGGKVCGVKAIDGTQYSADKVVLCAGAWTQRLLSQCGIELEGLAIAPVKGQMILFASKPGLVNRVVLKDGKYVIPRRDGQVLAGSTLEHTGFEKKTDAQAKEALAGLAISLYPDLAHCAITHHWAGLRPGSPDGIPFIGEVPGNENLYVNAGHFRNGLVLAPASVALMTSILCDEECPVDPAPYTPALRCRQI